ncbi:MAG: hypothetical protein ABIP75_05680 [Pyrinomonadaceae bacterium]
MKYSWLRKFVLVLPAALLIVLLVGSGPAQTTSTNTAIASPEAQTKRIYEAIRDLNFRDFYYLLAVSPKLKKRFPADPETFARDMREGFEGGPANASEAKLTRDMFNSIREIMVGPAVITGKKAVVPTSARITVEGHNYLYEGSAHLILDDGEWKLDLTDTDDLEVAMTKSTMLLLGSAVSVRPT